MPAGAVALFYLNTHKNKQTNKQKHSKPTPADAHTSQNAGSGQPTTHPSSLRHSPLTGPVLATSHLATARKAAQPAVRPTPHGARPLGVTGRVRRGAACAGWACRQCRAGKQPPGQQRAWQGRVRWRVCDPTADWMAVAEHTEFNLHARRKRTSSLSTGSESATTAATAR